MNFLHIKTFLVFIFFLSLQQKANSQKKEILAQLKSKDFNSFILFTDSIQKNGGPYERLDWFYHRNIVDNYQESLIYYSHPLFHSDRLSGTLVKFYKIRILSIDGLIFHYEFGKKTSNYPKYQKVRMSKKFHNDSIFRQFKTDFYKTYHANIDQKDLFNEDIQLGGGCGFAGFPPNGRSTIELNIKNENIKQIDQWLVSCNTEKQIYAVEAYYRLQDNGYKIPEEVMNTIKIIYKKEGTVNYCSGCTQNGPVNLHFILSEFKFD